MATLYHRHNDGVSEPADATRESLGAAGGAGEGSGSASVGREYERDLVAERLRDFERVGVERADLRQAAVAVAVVVEGGRSAVVLTRRASRMRSHAGQWALPGGRRDVGEPAVAAALREMDEEVGLQLPEAAVLGVLDDYVSRSGYVITPVVVWAGELAAPLVPHEAEVASIHLLPLRELDVDPVFVTIPESERPVIRLPLYDGFVHAPTAAALYQFREVALHGRSTRVAGYEEPVWVWKR